MESANVTRAETRTSYGCGRPLRQEEEADGKPDDEEPGKNPEQERRLADWQPWQLAAVEEEPRTTGRAAVSVVYDHLTSHGLRRVVGRLTFGVEIHDPSAPVGPARMPARAWHEESLPILAVALASLSAGEGSWALQAASGPDVP
jgi:hypothetical protein